MSSLQYMSFGTSQEKERKFREISKGIFTIKMKDSQTILEAKKLINQKYQSFPIDGIRLIHKGKILSDETKMKDVYLFDNEFIVCYVVPSIQNQQQKPCEPEIPSKQTKKPLDANIEKLMEFTNCTEEEASKMLKKCNGNIETAIDALLSK